jgi:hypothetical protein
MKFLVHREFTAIDIFQFFNCSIKQEWKTRIFHFCTAFLAFNRKFVHFTELENLIETIQIVFSKTNAIQ